MFHQKFSSAFKEIMGKQKGKDGEEKIKRILEEYYQFNCSETAGASKRPDISFTTSDFIKIGIEVKSGKANECGNEL